MMAMADRHGGSKRMNQIVTVVAAALLIGACGKKEPEAPAVKDVVSALQNNRPFSTESLFRGARLFQEHCAQCHGPEAQGHPAAGKVQLFVFPLLTLVPSLARICCPRPALLSWTST